MSTNQVQTVPPQEEEEAAAARVRRRRRIVFSILGVLVVAGAVVGTWYYLYSLHYEWTDDAFIEGHIIQVSSRVPGRVIKVLVDDNRDVKADDLVVEIDPRDFEVRAAQARAGLESAESQRKTAEINVGLTKTVTAASVDQAAAGVVESKAGIDMARAGAAIARSQIIAADAKLAASRAQAEQAKAVAVAAEAEAQRTADDLKRYEELFAANRISRQQIDAARTAARAAAAQHTATTKAVLAAEAAIAAAEAEGKVAADNVKLAEAQAAQAEGKLSENNAKLDDARAAPQRIAAAESQLKTATSEVERIKALLAQAELELSYTKIRAPEAGYVTRKSVEPGAFFQAGQAMMAIVAKNVWVVANFKETSLDRIRPGQPVAVTIDAYPDKVFQAHVDSIQAGSGSRFSLLPPENATGNFVKVVQRVPVKIVFDEPPDPKYHLAPGMSVIPEVKVE